MLKKSKNSFQSLDEIKVSSKTYKIFNLKKAEQSDMKDLSPEVSESVKSLREAAEMVNNPFKVPETKTELKPETEQLESNPIEKQDK